MGHATLKQLAASLPAGVHLIGIDEDTALVRFEGGGTWQVLGRQGVSVIDANKGEVRHVSGDQVLLGGSAASTPAQ